MLSESWRFDIPEKETMGSEDELKVDALGIVLKNDSRHINIRLIFTTHLLLSQHVLIIKDSGSISSRL
ncbi:hypothetical protein L1987_11664 [Smallanthus sonchifolius]|uniref:Uncharacterized protein n=1 Tax=Smallanthus sonchifolius TaxID=185202 RepID=A0ACB9JE82_9ASTR|nr:hypothetical protein L1987_11664 [Smallanthus sonchifolius]